jgi:molybdopterin molybdotransferase
LTNCALLPPETVALAKAAGRVLGQTIRADRDLPPADRSAMDGYAVRAEDLASTPRELRVIAEAAAGSAARPRIRPGTCARIFTGANVPPGADSVAIIETTTEVEPGRVRFRASVSKGENIRRRGENARKGSVLLEKGCRLGPMQIAVCAAVGADPVTVSSRARAGILCSGHELIASTDRAAAHTERNSNGPALAAALALTRLAGCRMNATVEDDPVAMRRAVTRALGRCDVLLLVGGVSVGRYDYGPQALKESGCREVFHGVAMKPGKPTLFALGPAGQLVFGLPGNPLSAMTAFHEFVAPALRKMSGLGMVSAPKQRVRVESSLGAQAEGRTRFVPARLRLDAPDGIAVAVPVETHSSADLVAGGLCDGVIVAPPNENDRDGMFEFHSWILSP